MIKKVFKIIAKVLGVLGIMFGVYLLFMTITDYRPKKIVKLKVEGNREKIIKKGEDLSILTYNIGYCGLDKDEDFFMDGGKGSRSKSKEKTLENLKGISEFLEKEKNSFTFIQEVDLDSTRSNNVDEYKELKNVLKENGAIFAYNYKVPWIPIPIKKPHGKVNAGLSIFSEYHVNETNRYQYPGEKKWPVQLGLLDRCFIESRIKVENGKDLILVNSHLCAYDKGGVLRKQQLAYLKNYINKQYKQGNYIIVGGDWNHLIPGTDPRIFASEESWPEWLQKIPDSFKPEGFSWVADKSIPSNRTVDIPYEKGKNYLSVIDGFLVSPNVKVENVKGYDLEFKYTDHNPVKMVFSLN